MSAPHADRRFVALTDIGKDVKDDGTPSYRCIDGNQRLTALEKYAMLLVRQ